jgi:Tol biopolymer transport system component
MIAALIVEGCTRESDGTHERESPNGAAPSAATTPTEASTTRPVSAKSLSGTIAFSTQEGDIWVMDADGSRRRQVTDAGGFDFDPSFSPDGKRIVFRTTRGKYLPDPGGTGVEGISVVDADGSNGHQIQPKRGGLFPDWSPDGTKIALSSLQTDGDESIFVVNPDGSGLADLGASGGSGECSEWSPDGSKIMYCSNNGANEFDVWVMDADGSHKSRLTDAPDNDYPGAWSADGRQIAFSSERDGNSEVYVMNADGSDQTRLTDSPNGEAPNAWLPGGRIVFSSFHGDAPLPRWYLIDTDGTRVRALPQLRGAGDPIDWYSPPTLARSRRLDEGG